jgi:hypothetical protein
VRQLTHILDFRCLELSEITPFTSSVAAALRREVGCCTSRAEARLPRKLPSPQHSDGAHRRVAAGLAGDDRFRQSHAKDSVAGRGARGHRDCAPHDLEIDARVIDPIPTAGATSARLAQSARFEPLPSCANPCHRSVLRVGSSSEWFYRPQPSTPWSPATPRSSCRPGGEEPKFARDRSL